MHNPPKTQKPRDSTMSPTMQGAHTSVKMPQLQPSRGSLPGNMQPHTSISMYSHGNYAQKHRGCKYYLQLFQYFATTIFAKTTKDFLYFLQCMCYYQICKRQIKRCMANTYPPLCFEIMRCSRNFEPHQAVLSQF